MGHFQALQNEFSGDHVILQDPLTRLWDQRGVVVSVRDCTVDDASRSYLVDTGAARLKLRNRKFMRLSCSRTDWQQQDRVRKLQLDGLGQQLQQGCGRRGGSRRVTFQDQQNRF